MELDFTKLNSLAFMDFAEIPPEKQPSKTPLEPLLEPEGYKTPLEEENALQGQIEGLQGIPILQRQADANKAEKERALAVYREYQENIKRSGQLQTDILKGAKRGEDIYSLFLKAVQAISLMTSNTVFYSQLKDDIRAIYGAGLLEPKPLELELACWKPEPACSLMKAVLERPPFSPHPYSLLSSYTLRGRFSPD